MARRREAEEEEIGRLLDGEPTQRLRTLIAQVAEQDEKLRVTLLASLGVRNPKGAAEELAAELSRIDGIHAVHGHIPPESAEAHLADVTRAIRNAVEPASLLGSHEIAAACILAALSYACSLSDRSLRPAAMEVVRLCGKLWEDISPKLPTRRARELELAALDLAERTRQESSAREPRHRAAKLLEAGIVELLADVPDVALCIRKIADAQLASLALVSAGEGHQHQDAQGRRTKRARDKRDAAGARRQPPTTGACQWAIIRLRAMRSQGFAPRDLLSFADPYLSDDRVRLYLADALCKSGRTRAARQLLYEPLHDEPQSRSHRQLALDLLHLETRRGHRVAAVRAAGRAFVLTREGDEPTREELLDAVRSLTDARDWDAARSTLLAHVTNPVERAELLAHEGLWNELFELLNRQASPALLVRHEASLPPRLATHVAGLWARLAKQALEKAYSREEYEVGAAMLAHAAHLPGGRDTAIAMARGLCARHPKRWALRQELAREGLLPD